MSDDLNTADNEQEEQEGEVETTSREDYISSAYNALSAILEVTTLTKQDEIRKARITRKCLRILDDLVGEMYDELFNPEDDEND
jgi:hypothetical protein